MVYLRISFANTTIYSATKFVWLNHLQMNPIRRRNGHLLIPSGAPCYGTKVDFRRESNFWVCLHVWSISVKMAVGGTMDTKGFLHRIAWPLFWYIQEYFFPSRFFNKTSQTRFFGKKKLYFHPLYGHQCPQMACLFDRLYIAIKSIKFPFKFAFIRPCSFKIDEMATLLPMTFFLKICEKYVIFIFFPV